MIGVVLIGDLIGKVVVDADESTFGVAGRAVAVDVASVDVVSKGRTSIFMSLLSSGWTELKSLRTVLFLTSLDCSEWSLGGFISGGGSLGRCNL